MKQVDKRPTEGQFIAIREHDGELVAHTLKYIDGNIHNYDWDLDKWMPVEIEITLSTVTYFTAESALKEITFKEDYELLKWLKDNSSKVLHPNKNMLEVEAYFVSTSDGGGYRVSDETGLDNLLHSNYLQQKTWYHY